MSLTSIAPEVSAAFAKLHIRRAIKSVMVIAEVAYEDGGRDTIDWNEEGMLAVLKGVTRTPKAEVTKTEEVKVVPMPKAEKPKGTPKPKGEKANYKPPLWAGLCKTAGVAEYLTNGGKWITVAIIEDTTVPVVGKVKDGMYDASFVWGVKDTENKLRNRRFIKAGECKCDKCAKAKAA